MYIIAEIGINHNGDINIAKDLIKKSSEAKCNAVKLQKRDIDSVYTKEELESKRKSPWGTTFRQQKEGLEFNESEYKELEKFSESLGLDFIVSCWDLKSIDFVEKNCNVKYHKIASALLTNDEFLQKLNSTEKPVIVSTGMSDSNQIEHALQVLNNVEYILACTSTYPTKENEVNLKYINTLKKLYPDYKIGFSNHYNGHDACVGACVMESECIEFHVTQDRTMYGSDQSASIEDISKLTDALFKVSKMIGNGNKEVYESEVPIIKKLRK